MDQAIAEQLSLEDPSDFHKSLLSHVKGLTAMSRNSMSQWYDKWDEYDRVYRGESALDVQDQKAQERKEPVKMVVPTTYAQVQTFIAFCFSLYYQRERLFTLVGSGPEDASPAKTAEAVLDRDLQVSLFDSRLYQFLLDIGRFGIGVMKTGWTEETQMTTEEVSIPSFSLYDDLSSEETTVQEVEKIKFQGTRVDSVSPYNFYPDPRVPLLDFQKGEFVASEAEFTLTQLQEMQDRGEIAGLEHVEKMTSNSMELRSKSGFSFSNYDATTMTTNANPDSFPVVITEIQIKLDPRKFKVNGEPMNPEGRIEKWNVWVANDQRVVKAEPLGYLHDEFTYVVGQYSEDNNSLVNMGLAELIHQLQAVITWFINSRVTAVRKTINNWLIVDPDGVEMSDLQQRNPVIRVKPGKSGMGVDRWIKQLNVQDVTTNHLNDVEVLNQIVQTVTGINETALGQFHGGRRSATEAKSVASAAAARLRVVARLLFNNSLVSLAKQIVSNARQGMDTETIVKVVGGGNTDFRPVTRADLIGNYDFQVFDGTMPTEKQYQAEALSEVLQTVLTNPQAAMILQYDPKKLMDEILELRGIRNPSRFHLPPPPIDPNAIQPVGPGGAVDSAQGAVPGAGVQLPAGVPGAGVAPVG